MPFLVFYVPYPDETAAQESANNLLERRLIACANIFPMTSAYWWQGQIQHESEWVAILKTRSDLENQVETAVQALHSNETPCIMRFEVRANQDYEDWIASETIKV